MVTGLHAPKTLRGLFVCIILLASACNLKLQSPASPVGGLASGTATETSISGVQPSGTGFQVEILSPLNGAEVPAGQPLTVTARCTGGVAIEAMLSVDSNSVANLPSSIPPGQAIELVWPSPTEGKHRLTVEFLDDQKTSHPAEIDILVVASAASTASATETPTPGGATISFISLTDGSPLTAGLDSAGEAFATVTLQAEGDSIKDIILEADGLQVARAIR
jgi:hypothetical protein